MSKKYGYWIITRFVLGLLLASKNCALADETLLPAQTPTANTTPKVEQVLRSARESANSQAPETLRRAVTDYRSCINTFEASGDKRSQATTLVELGQLFYKLNEIDSALDIYLQAVPIFDQLADVKRQGETLNYIGYIYELKKQYQEALENYRRSLSLRKATGDNFGEAQTQTNIGNTLYEMEDYERSAKEYELALILREKMPEQKQLLADAYNNLGLTYVKLNRLNESIPLFKQALLIWQTLNDKVNEAKAWDRLGVYLGKTGKTQDAIDAYSQSAAIWEKQSEFKRQGSAWNNIGILLIDADKPVEAEKAFKNALSATRLSNSARDIAIDLHNIGFAQELQGNLESALGLYDQSLQVLPNEEKKARATTLVAKGKVQGQLGQFAAAVQSLTNAVSITNDLPDTQLRGQTLSDLAQIYLDAGTAGKALATSRAARQVFESIPYVHGQVSAWITEGRATTALGQTDMALAAYNQAVQLSRAGGLTSQLAVALHQLGLLHNDCGEPHKAEPLLLESLQLAKDAGDPVGQAWTTTALGWVELSLNHSQPAKALFSSAVTTFRSQRENAGLIWALRGSASACEPKERPESLKLLSEGIGLAHNLGRRLDEADLTSDLSTLENRLGHRQRALELMRSALKLFDSGDAVPRKARAMGCYADLLRFSGADKEALTYYAQSQKLLRSLGYSDQLASTLAGMGMSYVATSNPEKAKVCYLEALKLAMAGQNPGTEGWVRYAMGRLHADRGEWPDALREYQTSLALRHTAGDEMAEAETLEEIAFVDNRTGNRTRAAAEYDAVVKLYESCGDESSEATTLSKVASIYVIWNDYQKAQNYGERALGLYERNGDKLGLARTQLVLATICRTLDSTDRALSYTQQALASYQAANEKRYVAVTQLMLGILYYDNGDYNKAKSYFEKALPAFQAAQDAGYRPIALSFLALLHLRLGNNVEALRYANLTLSKQLAKETGAQQLNIAAYVYFKTHQWDKANFYYRAALQKATSSENYSAAEDCWDYLGRLATFRGQYQTALNCFYHAIQCHETLRGKASLEEIRITLDEQSADVYQRAVLLEVRLGHVQQAFDLTERARARSTLDDLGNAHLKGNGQADAVLIEREQTLRGKLAELDGEIGEIVAKPEALGGDFRSRLNTLAVARKNTAGEYHYLLTSLKLSNPDYASLVSINPKKLPELQKNLPADTTLLSYYVTAEETLIFVITKTTISLKESRVSKRDLSEIVRELRRFSDVPHTDRTMAALWWLHGQLIQPVTQKVKTRKLGIVPHSLLNAVPFSALTDGKKFVSDAYTVFQIPSVNAYPVIMRKRKATTGPVLAIAQNSVPGLPFLSGADTEARTVAGILGGEAVVTPLGTCKLLRDKASSCGILHIAAHAEMSNESAWFASLHLAPHGNDSGDLYVQDIYQLDLSKANLVMLSACDTGIGYRSEGDDVIDLSRAFLYAGSPSVIASLWKADDRVTPVLVRRFYQDLANGYEKSAALRDAQQFVRRTWPHPYYWAGFVLTGDPGQLGHIASGNGKPTSAQ